MVVVAHIHASVYSVWHGSARHHDGLAMLVPSGWILWPGRVTQNSLEICPRLYWDEWVPVGQNWVVALSMICLLADKSVVVFLEDHSRICGYCQFETGDIEHLLELTSRVRMV